MPNTSAAGVQVADIAPDHLEVTLNGIKVFLLPGGKVVQDADLLAALEQDFHEVSAIQNPDPGTNPHIVLDGDPPAGHSLLKNGDVHPIEIVITRDHHSMGADANPIADYQTPVAIEDAEGVNRAVVPQPDRSTPCRYHTIM